VSTRSRQRFGAYPLADPLLIGDINRNGGINVTDAMILTREVNYLTTGNATYNRPEIADIPAGIDTLAFHGADPLVIVRGTSAPWRVGWSASRSCLRDRGRSRQHPLEAVELTLAWDPGQLELVSVGRGSLTGDFDNFISAPGNGT